jgi:glycosyltransferase involved in cell wall biosynthesis
MRRIPTVLSIDATPANYDSLAAAYGDRVHAAPVERLKLTAHRALVRRARRFTTWSSWAKSSLVRDYGAADELVTVLHPGTMLSRFPDPGLRSNRREGPLRVLFVGGDFRRKGGDVLLEAVRHRMRSRAELHLVTGADVAEGDGIHVYRGLKPLSSELLRLYADADVFALPTRGDCLAVVLGEAMAACLPIITTSVGAHGEAVEDEHSGFIVPTDDVEAVAARLDQLASDWGLARRMGARARAIAEERFDMQKNAHRIADLMLETAERG